MVPSSLEFWNGCLWWIEISNNEMAFSVVDNDPLNQTPSEFATSHVLDWWRQWLVVVVATV